MTQKAIEKSNKNEQYSRKSNIKFLGLPEKKVLNDALQEVGINLEEKNIVAMHRIPGQKDKPKPILVKMRNSEEKTSIMRKRAEIRDGIKGWKVMDVVTKHNILLIKRLVQSELITSTWYFNGYVYGQSGMKRIKFDIFDDI